MPLKLLIIVSSYPPEIGVAARRWGNLVASLQLLGVKCTVICVGKNQLIKDTGGSGEEIFNYSNTEIPRKNIERKNKTGRNSFYNWLKSSLIQLLPVFIINREIRKWLIKSRTDSEFIRLATESDFIISSFGGWEPFMMGWWLGRKINKPWVADLRDSFELRTGYRKVWPANKFDHFFFKKILGKAAYRITIGQKLADYLSLKYGTIFYPIYNGWTNNDLLNRDSIQPGNRRYLYYAGTIYSHQLPALLILIKSLSHFPEMRLIIRLLKDNTNGELNSLINRYALKNQIEILSPANQETVNQELAQSIGVIVIESIDSSDTARNGTVTGKLISLLVSGIPGIAIVSKEGEISDLVKKANGWFCVDSEDECINGIKEILNLKNGVNNTESLNEYNFKIQAMKFLEIINSNIIKHTTNAK